MLLVIFNPSCNAVELFALKCSAEKVENEPDQKKEVEDEHVEENWRSVNLLLVPADWSIRELEMNIEPRKLNFCFPLKFCPSLSFHVLLWEINTETVKRHFL